MLRFAFIGFRHSHVLGLYHFVKKHDAMTVVAACEEHAPTREALLKDGKVAITHEGYAKMLDEVDCDVVAVGDYYGIRGRRIIEALERGKHVVSDKPICISLDEFETIKRLAHAKKLSVSCQLDMRGNGHFLKARELIRGGVIGEVHAIQFNGQHPLLPGSRPGWYFEEGKHGGTINDIGVHAFDFIPWITGLKFAEALFARTYKALPHPYPNFLESAQFLLRLDNGCGVIADVSYLAPDSQGYTLPQYWRTTFCGEKGLLETGVNLKEVFLALNGEKTPQSLAPLAAQPFSYLDGFLREIAGEKTGLTLTTQEVLDASRTALFVQRAADQHQTHVKLA